MFCFAASALLLLSINACPVPEECPLEAHASQVPASTEPGSPEALRAYLIEIRAAVKAGDEKKAEELARNLVLKDPGTFFRRAFGSKEGERMAVAYEHGKKDLISYVLNVFGYSVRRGASEFNFTRFQDVPAPQPGHKAVLEVEVVRALKQRIAFYRVSESWRGSTDALLLEPFAYVDGSFYLIPSWALFALSTAPQMLTRVRAQSQGDHISSEPMPTYPKEAKALGVQGTVRLQAIIARDGTIKEITVLSGPPELVDSAMTVVRQWRYQPTLLDGVPVEVVAAVEVVYTLAS